MALTFDDLKAEARALGEAGIEPLPVEGLRITLRRQPEGPIHALYRPSLCVVLQGSKTSLLGERAFRYDAGKCLITSLDVPIRAEITGASAAEPYLAFSLGLDAALVAELLLALPPAPAVVPPAPRAALDVEPLDAGLIEPLHRLMRLCRAPAADVAVLAPLAEREIVWRLMQGPLGPNLRQIGLAESHVTRISRAVAHIRARFAAPLSIAELSALAGMSPATFHRHFKAVTAMTPVQFQKMIRLQEARRLLLAEGADVARVGYAIGYESASQFSREYRRLFGAPPGRDGAEMRAQLSA
ncbi:AraC family transcriptional regulator N-terminal domain-containing protein [Pseudoroseicyclus sp. CXY001]|uniref:AraC family transcriptional regulator n=1 Tax=Pseudoroseicyclus sp. CXY001 TaxID=3242492 RepID=UPI00357175AB